MDSDRAVPPDKIDAAGFAVILRLQRWRVVWHVGHGQTDPARPLVQKPADIAGRDAALDHAALNRCPAAARHSLKHSLIELDPEKPGRGHDLARWRGPAVGKMNDPANAAAAADGLGPTFSSLWASVAVPWGMATAAVRTWHRFNVQSLSNPAGPAPAANRSESIARDASSCADTAAASDSRRITSARRSSESGSVGRPSTSTS